MFLGRNKKNCGEGFEKHFILGFGTYVDKFVNLTKLSQTQELFENEKKKVALNGHIICW